MFLVILFVAIAVITVSLTIVIQPASLRTIFRRIMQRNWLWPVSLIRVVLGCIFILGSSETSFPFIILFIGIVMLLAGISVPFIGRKRIEEIGEYMLNQKDWVLRICGIFGLLFGITLAMSGLPA